MTANRPHRHHALFLPASLIALGLIALIGLSDGSADHAFAGNDASDQKTIRPFNGENLDNWERTGRVRRDFWTIGTPAIDPENPESLIVKDENGDALISHTFAGADLHTERKFRDARIEFEVMLPESGNSGLYLMGEYELQLRHQPDADPENPGGMDHGAIARLAPPKKLVIPEPGKWQKILVAYRAPRFNDAGEKTANMRVKRIVIDGQTVQKDVEIPENTLGGITVEEQPEGPAMLQGGERPAAFRNIRITPLK
jgi:hypothetical protein